MTALQTAIQATSPVRYWPFSDGSNASLTEAVAGDTGSVIDTANWRAEDVEGRGAYLRTFGTGDYALLGMPTTLPENDQISFFWTVKTTRAELVDTWVYSEGGAIDNTPTPGQDLLLFEYNGSSVFGDVAGQLSFTFGQFYTRHVTPYVTTPTVDWRDGNWHNIAIVIDFQNDTARDRKSVV